MDKRKKEFDVVLICNLKENYYEIQGEYALFLEEIPVRGEYDKLIQSIADIAPEKYGEMLLSQFTCEALLSSYNADNTYVFCNSFFKYTATPTMGWAAIAARIDEDLTATVFIRSIDTMYNDCAIMYATADRTKQPVPPAYDHKNCRLAMIYDSASESLDMLGGSVFFNKELPLAKKESVHNLIGLLSPFLDPNSNASFMSEAEFINLTLTSVAAYGGYHFKRFLYDVADEQRWYELAVLALDNAGLRYLVTIKDIHEMLGRKVYVSGMPKDNLSEELQPYMELVKESSRIVMNRIKTPFCSFSLESGLPVRQANDLFYRAIGYTPEVFEYALGNSLIALCHPADIPYMRSAIKDIVSNDKQPQLLEVRIVRSDGNIRWTKLEIYFIASPQETVCFLTAEDITDKKLQEQSKLSDRQNFSMTYAKSTNILFDYDCATHTLKDRGGLVDNLGFPPEVPAFDAYLMSGDLVADEDEGELKRVIASVRSGAEAISGSFRIKVPKRNDQFARISFTLSTIFDYKGQPKQLIGVIDKISLQRIAEDPEASQTASGSTDSAASGDSDASKPKASPIFNVDLSAVGMNNVLASFTVNISTDTIESHSGASAFGAAFADFTGRGINETAEILANGLVAENYRESFLETFNTAHLADEFAVGNADITTVYPLSHPSLADQWAKIFVHMVADLDGSLRALVYACDVSEEYRKISALESVSTKDPLTGLLNRSGASESITAYLNRISDNELCAFMIMDLDNFKEINDIYGHQAGDEYLKSLADALTDFLPDAIVARLGGDEFVVFLKNCTGTSQISNTALSILKIIKDVNHSRITAFNTTGSIGIALVPSYGKEFDTLYHNADVALYEVKKNSKDGFMFCDDRNPTVHHSGEATKSNKKTFSQIFSKLSVAMYALLIASLLLASGITFLIFQTSISEIFKQANSQIESHSNMVGKYMGLYMTTLQEDASWLAQIATRNQESLMNSGYVRDDKIVANMDDLVLQTDFDNVLLVGENGKLFYRYAPPTKRGSFTMADGLQNKSCQLPDSVARLKTDTGSLVFASNIYSSNGKHRLLLLCTISGETVSSTLDSLTTFDSEKIFLTDNTGIVIGSNIESDNMLFKYYSNDYLAKSGYTHMTTVHRVIDTDDDVREPSSRYRHRTMVLMGHAAPVNLPQLYTNYYVFAVTPQEAILGNATVAIRIVVLLFICLFIAIVLSTIFIIRNDRKSNKYVDNLAYKDSLTGLNNMNYLEDNSKSIFKKCGEPCGVVSLHVDNFRVIRDAYGPAKSNKLITCIGNAISDFIGSGEAAGRVSDASFCLVLSYVGENAFNNKLKNLRSYIFSSCSTYMATSVNFTISIGAYLCESSGESVKQDYDLADLARSYMKESSGEGICYYNTNLQQSIQKQKLIEDSLDAALENGEFVPYYQPIVNIFSHKVVGCEALARWVKPDGTIVPPNEFIPFLDKRGSIVNLDYYMFEKTCAQMQIWKDSPLEDVAISINMSRQHFYQPDFIERLMRTTAKYGIPNSRIHIEITESIYIGDANLINKTLTELRDNGFLVSMDDFGTGYSSMSMLQNMPIDILKIDKSFLDSSLSKESGIIVLDGVVNIAKQLGLKTICEGVESSNQLNWLKTVGCDMVQGFYYSKPIPAADLENFIMDNFMK